MVRGHIAVWLAGALLAAPPAQAQRMQGFADVAADRDVVTLKVPGWMRGKIGSDGAARGSVRRKALGTSDLVDLFGLTVGGAERFGRFSFDIATDRADEALVGDCIYDRTERRVGVGALTISQPLRPLLLRCRFERDGIAIGGMEIEAAPRTAALVQPSRRTGHVEMLGTRLGIESEHRMQGAKVPTDAPVGYRFRSGDASMGGVDLTGFNKRPLAMAKHGNERLAALAAGTALAVFWDPGDTND